MNLLLDFKQHASQAEIDAYLTAHNCTVVSVFNRFEKVYHVTCPMMPPANDIIEGIHNNEVPIHLLSETVVMYQSPKEITIDVNDDRNWWKMASIFDVNFQQNHVQKRYGEFVKIYVVDSGVDTTHQEFAKANIHNLWSFNNDFTDTNGHGTAITSILVGETCGLTDAAIRSVKIFDKNQTTYVSDILAAFNAIANDFDGSREFGVVNLSWAMPRNTFLDSKIQVLMEMGLIVVAAAGNNGGPVDEITPAGIPDVYTIGAYNDQFMACDWTNYTGPSDLPLTDGATNTGALDGWAPGQNIYVALPGNRYGTVSGTSFAAPIHCGAIAYYVDLHCYEVDGTLDVTTYGYLRIKANMDMVVFSRRNILNLDGRYSASANRISTYPGTNSSAVKKLPYNQFAFISGQFKSVTLFYPTNTVAVEIIDPLPGTLKISNVGQLAGVVTFDPSVTDQDFYTTTHRLKLYRPDGSADDYNLEITTVSESVMSTLDEPDSPWRGVLTAVNCSPFTCVRDCPAFNPGTTVTICDFGPPKFTICDQCLAD